MNDLSEDRRRSFIDRIDRLETQRARIAAAIEEIYAEAGAAGFAIQGMREDVYARVLRRDR